MGEHVTIVSDVSQEPKTLRSTYCIKAIHDGKTVTYKGNFKQKRATEVLEAWASYLGLCAFISTNTLPPGSIVKCYCDIIGYSKKYPRKVNPWAPIYRSIDRLSKTYELNVELHWMGDVGGGTPLRRTYNRCHKEALNKLRGRK